MGLLPTKKKKSSEVEPVVGDGAMDKLVRQLLDFGLDGAGPMSSAAELGAEALRDAGGDPNRAIQKITRRGVAVGGITGFLTGLGGFVTMPVALPANVAAFYLQATRMVGAVAAVRGYDLTDKAVRTAILLCLVGSDADDVLRKAGMKATPTGMVTGVALKNLPPAALMVVNKAIGFRLIRGLGERALSKLGRGIPVAGGAIGGGLDVWMMNTIAKHSIKEFPPVAQAASGVLGTVVPGPQTPQVEG